MQREPQLVDDLSDDGDLAMLAGLSVEAVAVLMNDIAAMPTVKANAYVREFALQILEELGPHLTEWETGFCGSILAWVDRRRLSVKQIETLHYVTRNAARRTLAAKRRACRFMAAVVPVNTLPL
jgi:hypothetical protein